LSERLGFYIQIFNQNSWKENISIFFPPSVKRQELLSGLSHPKNTASKTASDGNSFS